MAEIEDCLITELAEASWSADNMGSEEDWMRSLGYPEPFTIILNLRQFGKTRRKAFKCQIMPLYWVQNKSIKPRTIFVDDACEIVIN